MTLGHLAENARRVLANSRMLRAYAAWTFGQWAGDPTLETYYGAKLSDFENFSNYWGTLSNIPPQQQFEFFASFLKNDDICLDIGANVGSCAIILGKLCSSVRIHAFEPTPGKYRILNQDIYRKDIHKVAFHWLAVSDVERRSGCETVRGVGKTT